MARLDKNLAKKFILRFFSLQAKQYGTSIFFSFSALRFYNPNRNFNSLIKNQNLNYSKNKRRKTVMFFELLNKTKWDICKSIWIHASFFVRKLHCINLAKRNIFEFFLILKQEKFNQCCTCLDFSTTLLS